jgi:hypothetical protein
MMTTPERRFVDDIDLAARNYHLHAVQIGDQVTAEGEDSPALAPGPAGHAWRGYRAASAYAQALHHVLERVAEEHHGPLLDNLTSEVHELFAPDPDLDRDIRPSDYVIWEPPPFTGPGKRTPAWERRAGREFLVVEVRRVARPTAVLWDANFHSRGHGASFYVPLEQCRITRPSHPGELP